MAHGGLTQLGRRSRLADVLWFPTGGGKTEAYLGLISRAALYDRLRGKRFGVTAWLRFPLRMLSVEQLQTGAVKVLWETEQERRQMLGDASTNSDQISLGYYVGKTSTPNATSGGRTSESGPLIALSPNLSFETNSFL